MLLLFLCIASKVLDFLTYSRGTTQFLFLIMLHSSLANDSWLDSLLNTFDLDAERVLVDQNF